MVTKSVGFVISRMDMQKNLNELFALDVKVANATPALLPLKTKEKFSDFMVKEHNSTVFAAREQTSGKLMGYISLISNQSTRSMEILSIGVDPELQSNGCGRKLMEFAEKMAKESGMEKLTLVTNARNTQAINFYKKLGYVITKEIPNHYGDGEVRYLFEKSLSQT